MIKKIYLFLLASLLYIPANAQSAVSAEGREFSVWAGAFVSSFNPDFGCVNASPFRCSRQVIGIGPFAETNPFLFGRIGVEGEARFLHWHGPSGQTQSNYLIGPQISVFHHKRWQADVKVLAGHGEISLPNRNPASGGYFVYAPGVAVEYRTGRRISVRGDYEYQEWPDFRSTLTGHSGLDPNGFTLGVSYKVF